MLFYVMFGYVMFGYDFKCWPAWEGVLCYDRVGLYNVADPFTYLHTYWWPICEQVCRFVQSDLDAILKQESVLLTYSHIGDQYVSK